MRIQTSTLATPKQRLTPALLALGAVGALLVGCGNSEPIRLPNANANQIQCLPGMPFDSLGNLCVVGTSIEQLCASSGGAILDTAAGRLCRATSQLNFASTATSFSRLTPALPTPSGTAIVLSIRTTPHDRITVSGTAKYGTDANRSSWGPAWCESDDYQIDRDGFNFAQGALVNNPENGLPAGLMMSNGQQALPLFSGGPTYTFAGNSNLIYLGFNSATPPKACMSFNLKVSVERCFNLAGAAFPCP
jgi:hypothetical protein